MKLQHQDALGQLDAGDALDHVELGGVLELALARVEVEVDAPDPSAVEADVVGRDLLVPRAGLVTRDGRPLQPEQAPGDVEEALPDLLEGEVGAHHLAVDVVLLTADELGVVAGVVGRHRVGARVVGALALEEHRDLLARALDGRDADPLDEVGDGLAGADHLDLGVVVGPRVVAEQVGGLATHRQQVLEHLVVGRPGDVAGHEGQLAAGLAVGAEGGEGDQVGVVGGDRDQAVVLGRVGDAVVVGEPGEPLGREPDRADVVADVATELLGQLQALLAELAQPVAGGLVAVDAGPTEVAQRVVEHPTGIAVEPGGVERVEDGEQVEVLAQLGDVLLHLLAELVGPVAHRGVGVHLGPEVRHVGVGDRRLGAVPRGQHARGVGRAGLHELDLPHCLGEPALGQLGDPGEPVTRSREVDRLGLHIGVMGHPRSL